MPSRKCTVWENHFPRVDVVGTPACYLFGFMRPPVLDPIPIETASRVTIQVGDRIKTVKGLKNSAGFFQLEMLDGKSLEYRGMYQVRQNVPDPPKLLCFSQCTDGVRDELSWGDKTIGLLTYHSLFFGWQLFDNGASWFFTTPSVSGRIVETQIVELDTPETQQRLATG